jgi:exopolysaccharide production protein ExoZ
MTKYSLVGTGDIRTLQYGRGLAALFVCLFHYEGMNNQIRLAVSTALDSMQFDSIFFAGHSGVEFFFVLSGFIIYQAHHRTDLGRPTRLGSFYRKRVIRVLPMFWLVAIPYGLAALAISSGHWLTPGTFLLDLFLIPRDGVLTLSVAWTLEHEIVFYLLFGCLIINKGLGAGALALWQIACLVVLVFTVLPQDYRVPATTLLGYYNFGFLFGIMIALLQERIDFVAHRRGFALLGGIGAIGLLACFVVEWRLRATLFSSPAGTTLTYFVLYSLVILALLSAENKPRPLLDATLGALGAASYILYLIHEPLYSALEKIIPLSAPHLYASATMTFLLYVAVAIAVSLSLHVAIERPALRMLRRRFLPSPGEATK